MGGAIARHSAQGDAVTVAVLTGHGDEAPHPLWPKANWDDVRREAAAAMAVLGVEDLRFEEIPAAIVSDQPLWKLNSVVARVVNDVAPHVLYVPFPFDLPKDHREIFHAASVAWRPSTEAGQGIREVYCYEVQSETHWNIPYVEAGFLPNHWVDISDHLATKLKALGCYESQMQEPPHARSLRAIEALAVWRGSQIGVTAAEAFVSVRVIR